MRLRDAQENVGFYYLTGHGVPAALIERMFAETARFHAQPAEAKLAIRQNADNVGYMAPKQAISRANNLDEVARRPDRVEAFFMKRDLAPDHPGRPEENDLHAVMPPGQVRHPPTAEGPRRALSRSPRQESTRGRWPLVGP